MMTRKLSKMKFKKGRYGPKGTADCKKQPKHPYKKQETKGNDEKENRRELRSNYLFVLG